MEHTKKVAFSAIKPSGNLTIGNYIGATKNWVRLQEEYNAFYAVADLHAITVEIEPAKLREYSLDVLAFLLALGIDPNKSTIFMQSHVKEHSQLAWVLNCYTQFGEARRMTQFKDKNTTLSGEAISSGLFSYPMLMAADILLYSTSVVPIGKDQQQHLELSRTIAERFNNKYSPTFILPEGVYPKEGAKIYSLANPSKKMGKSEDDPHGVVLLKDDPDTILRKFKRAVTDSETAIKYDIKNKPGVSNLLTIYATMKNITVKKAEAEFLAKSYVDLKEKAAEVVIETLKPVQEKFKRIRQDKKYLQDIMQAGAEKASFVARKMLSKVYRKIGFVL